MFFRFEDVLGDSYIATTKACCQIGSVGTCYYYFSQLIYHTNQLNVSNPRHQSSYSQITIGVSTNHLRNALYSGSMKPISGKEWVLLKSAEFCWKVLSFVLTWYKWYILPIGCWLYITYHLLREPETTVEKLSWFGVEAIRFHYVLLPRCQYPNTQCMVYLYLHLRCICHYYWWGGELKVYIYISLPFGISTFFLKREYSTYRHSILAFKTFKPFSRITPMLRQWGFTLRLVFSLSWPGGHAFSEDPY